MVTPNFPIYYKEMNARSNCLHFAVQIGKFGVPFFYAFATVSMKVHMMHISIQFVKNMCM